MLETRVTPSVAGVFDGGVRVAVGDVNGDGFNDIITAAGPGAAPHVKVFSGKDGSLLHSFLPFDAGFTGGVYVAAGDVNGDGKADIIVGAGPGAIPVVSVYDGATGTLLRSFLAYDSGFTGGVRVAAADVDGDGKADIITGAGPGAAPHVKVFDGATGALLQSFLAFDAGFTGGVYVAAGDVNGGSKADIITGAGAGAIPVVSVFDGASGQLLRSFFAYDTDFTGGVTVAAADVNGDGKADIITGAGEGGGPHVKVFDGATGTERSGMFAYDGGFTGGAYVAAGDLTGDGKADIVTGAGPGASAIVRALNGTTLAPITAFTAYDPVSAVNGFSAPSSTTPPSPPTPPPSSTAPTLVINTAIPGVTHGNLTIQGQAVGHGSAVVTVTAVVDSTKSLVPFDSSGNFSFTTSFKLDGTDDGPHTIVFQAIDAANESSQPVSVSFTLNTALTLDLAPESDTGIPGNQRTELGTVSLIGTASPNAVMTLLKGSTLVASAQADASGAFRFDNVTLDQEVNDLTVKAIDTQGNPRTLTRTFYHNSAPTVAGPVSNFSVHVGAQDTILNAPTIFSDADVNTMLQFNTSAGTFNVELFNQQTPKTVANFLNYVTSGRYANSIFHRSVPGFVIQGGGFTIHANPPSSSLVAVPTDAAVVNEPGISNQAGTIAMAKLGNDPNSATSQFFFNLVDNSRGGPSLDSQNGGFTAFGALRGNGQQVVNQLAAIPTQDRSGGNASSPFTNIPLQNYPQPPAGNFPGDTTAANYALINSVSVVHQPDPRTGDGLTFQVTTSDPTIVSAGSASGSQVVLHYPGKTGTATITVTATDKNGASAQTSFTVTVG
jgi:cyclophilin family peptidyl-prolyl cis-trans isomerase